MIKRLANASVMPSAKLWIPAVLTLLVAAFGEAGNPRGTESVEVSSAFVDLNAIPAQGMIELTYEFEPEVREFSFRYRAGGVRGDSWDLLDPEFVLESESVRRADGELFERVRIVVKTDADWYDRVFPALRPVGESGLVFNTHYLTLEGIEIESIRARGEPVTSEDQLTRPAYVDELFRRVSHTEPSDLLSHEGQVHMQTLPAVGREDRHAEVEGRWIVPGQCDPAGDGEGDVLGAIAGQAANTRIVIINEAHDRPQHREFTRRLVMRLAPLGYTHFAAEAFDPDTLDNDRLPFARTDMGTYVNEPVFGSLVRTARDLGLELIAYDARISEAEADLEVAERVIRREERQAMRLAEVIAELAQFDRILIHVGYSHAAEVPVRGFDGDPLEWMAARLKRLTGIDPLSIDQTDCLSDSRSIQLAASSSRHVAGQYDLVVAHPDLAFTDGRPNWRAEGAIAKFAIPSHLLSHSARTIVEARLADEPMEAVPVDRVMLWPGESLPLLLPAGSYLLVGFDEDSHGLKSIEVHINSEEW